MIVGIIIIVVIFCAIGYGGYRANKKIKGSNTKKQDEIEKEFEKGNILLPVDKRDFEDLEEFKKNTSHIESVNEKIKNLDKDFDKLEFNIKKNGK